MHKRRKLNERYLEFALILTIIVIAIYVFIFLYSTNDDSRTLKLTEHACKDLGGSCKLECEDNEVQKTKCGNQMSCCVDIFPESPNDKVYLKLGLKENNIEYCNKIINLEMKASCKLQVIDNINYNFALIYNDSKYCKLIENQNRFTNCLKDLAKKTYNENICHQLLTPGEKNKCIKNIAVSKKTPELCLDITSEITKNSCIKDIAIDLKIESLCNQLTMNFERNKCKLAIELRNLKTFPKCLNLPESKCKIEKWCTPLYFYPDCENCPSKAFEICLQNNDLICESSGGTWNILKSTCNCQGKVWYNGFGCFKCNEFKTEYIKADCESKLI